MYDRNQELKVYKSNSRYSPSYCLGNSAMWISKYDGKFETKSWDMGPKRGAAPESLLYLKKHHVRWSHV